MKVFQTKSSKKKKIYHIYRWHSQIDYKAWCTKGSMNAHDYGFTPPEITEYDEDNHKLCPLCVGEAYRLERVKITPLH